MKAAKLRRSDGTCGGREKRIQIKDTDYFLQSLPFPFCRSSGALHNLDYGNLRLSPQATFRRCSAANRRYEKPGIFEMPGF